MELNSKLLLSLVFTEKQVNNIFPCLSVKSTSFKDNLSLTWLIINKILHASFFKCKPGVLSKSIWRINLSRILINRACLPVIVGFTITFSSSVLPFFIALQHFVSLPK